MAAPKIDFSGTWELDPERSDDVGAKLRAAQRAAERSNPGRSRRPARPSTGTWGNDPRADGSEESSNQTPMELEHDLRFLAIEHESGEMRISSAMPGSAYSQTVLTGGRDFERSLIDGSRVAAKAEWRRGGRLAIEYEGLGGRRVEEIWELVAEGSRILVTTRAAAKGLLPKLELLRVYDRVEIVPWDVPE